MTADAFPRRATGSSPRAAALVMLLGIPVAILLVGVSVTVGALDVGLGTVWDAIVSFDPESTQHQVIRELRLPRAIAATLVGACLATAGAVLQGTTRNHLASPGILGVNAGAALALAVGFAFLPGSPLHALVLLSMCGALLGFVIVQSVCSFVPGGFAPVRFVLAGAAVTALLASLTTAVVVHYGIAEDMLFFTAGGVSGARWADVRTMVPWAVTGIVAAIALAPSVAVLHLGEDAATGLGLRSRIVRRLAAGAVVVLAGASVAVAGPVGFVGLVVPHVARFIVGSDDRAVIPASAVLGAVLLGLSDIAARLIHPTREVPLGMVTALIGVPFLLHLVRRHRSPAR